MRNKALHNVHFENIEARVGNASSPTGDFTGSTLLAYNQPLANQNEVVVFEGSNPIWGRYVSLQSMHNDALIIANVNVLGKI